MKKKIIQFKGVSKYYDEYQKVVFNNINITFYNEVHAIVGTNGAGKTSFIQMLAGIESPSVGKIVILNERTRKYNLINDPSSMYNLQMAYSGQEDVFFPELTVRQNIALGLEKTKLYFFFNWKETNFKINNLMNEFNIKINLDKFVKDLAIEDLKKLSLLRALYKSPKILLLDEPTVGLSNSQKLEFGNIFQKLKEKQVTVIFTTRDLEFAQQVANKISYIKNNKINTVVKDNEEVLETLTFNYWIKKIKIKKPVPVNNDPFLYVKNFNFYSKKLASFYDLDFTIRLGEIYGIYDYNNIHSEVILENLVSLNKKEVKKEVWLDKKYISYFKTSQFNKLKIDWLATDYYQKSILENKNLYDNFIFWNYHSKKYVTKTNIVKFNQVKSQVDFILKKYQIDAQGTDLISSLSKGQVQKFLLARSIEEKPKVLILSNVFNDLDKQSTAFIIEQLVELVKTNQTSILLIDSNPNILELLCNSVAIIYNYKFVAKLFNKDVNVENMVDTNTWDKFNKAENINVDDEIFKQEISKWDLQKAKIKRVIKIICTPVIFIKNRVNNLLNKFHSRWG